MMVQGIADLLSRSFDGLFVTKRVIYFCLSVPNTMKKYSLGESWELIRDTGSRENNKIQLFPLFEYFAIVSPKLQESYILVLRTWENHNQVQHELDIS